MVGSRDDVIKALLAVLANASGPIGTRAARAALEDLGVSLSESSVSRRLRELDAQGWSIPVDTKGRVLSPEGRRRYAALEFSDRTTESIGRAVDIRDVQDLLDLLQARKAVESAAAADAASHASPADLEELQELISRHRLAVGTADIAEQPGLDLHRKIASIARNRMLKTLTSLVLAPHLDSVEAVLDIVLGSDEHQHHVIEEHQRIVDAISSRDPGAAEAAMDEHFEEMIIAGQRLITGENASVVSRLLSWMETNGRPLASELVQD